MDTKEVELRARALNTSRDGRVGRKAPSVRADLVLSVTRMAMNRYAFLITPLGSTLKRSAPTYRRVMRGNRSGDEEACCY